MTSPADLAILAEPPWVCFLGVTGVFLYLTMFIATAKLLSVWDGEPKFWQPAWQIYAVAALAWPLVWFIRGAHVLGRVIVRVALYDKAGTK